MCVCVCVCVRVSEHVCLAAHTQETEDVNNEEKNHARIKLSNKPKEKKRAALSLFSFA